MLTTNSMILGRYFKLLDDSPEEEEVSNNWKKQQKKGWERWMHDYLVALRERHNLSHKEKLVKISIIDVVLIKGGKKNRAK